MAWRERVGIESLEARFRPLQFTVNRSTSCVMRRFPGLFGCGSSRVITSDSCGLLRVSHSLTKGMRARHAVPRDYVPPNIIALKTPRFRSLART